MAREGLRVREVSEVEGNPLLRIVRRSSGSVVTWRRAQMVLLSVQGMAVAGIAKVTFTSAERVREVIHTFNVDGLMRRTRSTPVPAHRCSACRSVGRSRRLLCPAWAIMVCRFRPGACRSWRGFWWRRGVVDDLSQEGLRVLLRDEEVSFQAVKTWKASTDPNFEAKKNRVVELYDIAEGKATPGLGDPTGVFSMDAFAPLNVQPRPGRQWAPVVRRNKKGSIDAPRRRRQRATCTRTQGVRHLFGALDMNRDRLYGHMKTTKNRTTFLEFCRYLRSLYPPEVCIAIVMDNSISHLSTKKDTPGRGVGGGQLLVVGLPADQCQFPQPDRVSLHRPALLRPQQH